MFTIVDMKALVTAVQGLEDSPVQQNKAELTRQLYSEKRYTLPEAFTGRGNSQIY
jgi:hypothetical protein